MHFRALKVALVGGLGLVGADVLQVGDPFRLILNQRVLGGDHHIGGAKEGVGPGGEHPQLVPGAGDRKVHLAALASANPVALLGLHPVDEVNRVQPIQQLLGIVGDAQHPLAFHPAHHLAPAALAGAADHFLIGQADFAADTPVDGHFRFIGQPMLIQLQKNPLRPLVVVGVGGVHLPGIVKGKTQALQLLPEVGDILPRHLGRGHMVFDGVVLSRQAKGIPADGVEHVVALHPPLPGDDVKGGVAARVPHMKPGSGGIGELNQAVILGL